MLTTFTTEHGHLVIRSEDLRRIEDSPEGCLIGWTEGDGRPICYTPVLGTAAENRDRITTEEARVVAVYEEAQRRARLEAEIMARVPRGRKAAGR